MNSAGLPKANTGVNRILDYIRIELLITIGPLMTVPTNCPVYSRLLIARAICHGIAVASDGLSPLL